MMAPSRPTLILWTIAVVGAIGVWIANRTLGGYVLSIVDFAGIFLILAVSLNVTNGFTGLFSLGHPAFMAIGGYVTAILTMAPAKKSMLLSGLPHWLVVQHWFFLPALIAAGLVASLIAVIVGFPVLRLRGHYLAVATLGLIFIVASLANNLDSYTRGALGLYGLPPLTNLWWVYLWVLVTIYVCWRLKHSSLGRAMLAIRGNELAAASVGIRVTRTRILAFCLGAFFAGAAGGLWTHLVTIITPDSFDVVLAFQLVVMVVIGGAGSITGAGLAAIVLTVAVEGLRPLEENLDLYGLSQIVVASGVLLVLIYRPKGLLGSREPAFLTGTNHSENDNETRKRATVETKGGTP